MLYVIKYLPLLLVYMLAQVYARTVKLDIEILILGYQ